MKRQHTKSRIYSVYFTTEEEALIRAIAAHNGTSLSFVIRTGLRQLAGLPTPALNIPAEKVAPSS